MTQIISLLMMALNLLTAVQGNPNLSPEFKATATSIAKYAITVAQNALANPTATTTPSAPPKVTAPLPQPQTPVYAGIQSTTTQSVQTCKNQEIKVSSAYGNVNGDTVTEPPNQDDNVFISLQPVLGCEKLNSNVLTYWRTGNGFNDGGYEQENPSRISDGRIALIHVATTTSSVSITIGTTPHGIEIGQKILNIIHQ